MLFFSGNVSKTTAVAAVSGATFIAAELSAINLVDLYARALIGPIIDQNLPWLLRDVVATTNFHPYVHALFLLGAAVAGAAAAKAYDQYAVETPEDESVHQAAIALN